MNKQTVKILALCSVGGALGCVIGAEIGPRWLAIPLMLIGAFAAYLLYDPRQTVFAAKHAWRAAMLDIRSWKAHALLRMFGWGLLASAWVSIWLALVFACIPNDKGWSWGVSFVVSVFFMFGFCNAFLVLYLCIVRHGADWQYDHVGILRACAIHLAPPAVLYHVARNVPRVCRFAKYVCWKFFILVHSEAKLLCSVSVLVGAIAGVALRAIMIAAHYPGIPFIYAIVVGAGFGGVYGYFGHEIITKHVLIPKGYLRRIV